ncbi:MAG: hypothetical protein RL693_1880 [Verrucomicrobiota bacterium]|jgi:uncharacterized membrane protein YeaQ/YmgE (transglycosylase-associated protein family)
MDLLWTLLVGLLVGVVAKLLMPGRDPGGFIITMILGVAGAFIAGYSGRFLGWYGSGELVSFIASVIGAMLLLLVYRTFTKSRMAH